MAVKITYKCDICNDDTNTGQLFGVVFSNLTEFTLGGYGSTKGTHLCYRCAKQLKEHLNTVAISELLK